MKDFKNLTFDELQAEIAKMKSLPDVADYLNAIQELENKKQERKKEAERKQQVSAQEFISKLYPIIVKILNSVNIPDKNDAWLEDYGEWPDDIVINTDELEAFLLDYYKKTGAEVFEELAYNIVIRIEHNDTVYLAMRWDDEHYYYDQIEFEYSGSFDNITGWEIINNEILAALK